MGFLATRVAPLFALLSCFAPNLVFAQKVLIVYYTEKGHTQIMAESVATGATRVEGSEVRVVRVQDASNVDLLWADAVIVGSPVHAADVAAPIREFMSRWPIEKQEMKDKIGAAFVTGGGFSAGEELAQVNLLHCMLLYNMIVVGGPTWEQPFGASGITGEPPYEDKESKPSVDGKFIARAEALGSRVANVAKRFQAGGK